MSLVVTPVGVHLFSVPVLLVVLPVPFVDRTRRMRVHAVAVALVVQPIPDVATYIERTLHVSVLVDQAPYPARLVIFPESLVHRTVGPDLLSFSPLLPISPLSNVDGSVR